MEKFIGVDYINSLGKFTLKSSLERITEVLCLLGNPQDSFKSVHIAGTNGKGSVSAMVSGALKSSGKRVGTFISPHIVKFNERIKVGDTEISDSDLNRLSERIKDTGVELNKFEFITAVAFLYFSEQKIDIAVIETGLGGRLDATNVLKNVSVAVITKIGFDHKEILGNTLTEIANEKCGIIKSAKTVVSPNEETEVMEVINRYTTPTVPDKTKLKIINSDINGNEFIYKDITYKTSLAGAHQIENALIAVETLKLLKAEEKDIKAGLLSAFMPARLQVLSHSPLTVLDGAHNEDGAKVLSNFLKKYQNITAVVGVMRDKEYEKVLKNTLPFVKRVICINADNSSRSLSALELKTAAEKYNSNVTVAESPKAALEAARESSGEIFIFGSLYLAKGFLN